MNTYGLEANNSPQGSESAKMVELQDSIDPKIIVSNVNLPYVNFYWEHYAHYASNLLFTYNLIILSVIY